MEKVIISGIEGFIASAVKKNIEERYEIVGLSRNNGDVTKKETFGTLEGNYFIHLAGKLKGNLKEIFIDNIIGTKNVIDFCSERKIPLILASSAAIYGRNKSPLKEDTFPDVISDYGFSKWISEEMCRVKNQQKNFPFMILRIFNVYGPNQKPGLLIPDLIQKRKLKQIEIQDANSKRDFVYVEDVVSAIEKSLSFLKEYPTHNVFNIGLGESHSVEEISKIIFQGREISFNYSENPINSYADVSLASRILNWKPIVGIEEGLERTLRI
jgi:nucleoside-diphosphate-sugar epimerase